MNHTDAAGETRSGRALAWAFAFTWSQRGGAALVTLLLAAIVGPRDYGIVMIAMIYITLVELFLEQGISIALVQRSELEEDDLHSAFWMNLVWAGLLTVLSIGLAGWWAKANGEEELTPVIQVLSLLIPIRGLTLVQHAILHRQMRFKKLALRSGIAAVAGGVVGVTLALRGAGVWALVSQQVVGAAVGLIAMWGISRWRPRLRFSRRHARRLLGFSGHVFLGNLGNWVSRRSDALLIGLFFGPVAVGLYRFADRIVETLLSLGMRPMQLFTIPYLSRLQNEPVALRRRVEEVFRMTVLATIPAMMVLAAISDYLIALVDVSWEPAADVLKFLALVGIAKAFVVLAGPVAYAVGRPGTRTLWVWSIALVSAATFIPVAALLRDEDVGTQVVGIAASRAAVFMLVFVPLTLVIAARLVGLQRVSVIAPLIVPTLAGLAAIAAVALLSAAGLRTVLPAGVALLLATVVAVGVAVAVILALDLSARRVSLRFYRRVTRRAPAPWGRAVTEDRG
jgi:teichuronic acid exporter